MAEAIERILFVNKSNRPDHVQPHFKTLGANQEIVTTKKNKKPEPNKAAITARLDEAADRLAQAFASADESLEGFRNLPDVEICWIHETSRKRYLGMQFTEGSFSICFCEVGTTDDSGSCSNEQTRRDWRLAAHCDLETQVDVSVHLDDLINTLFAKCAERLPSLEAAIASVNSAAERLSTLKPVSEIYSKFTPRRKRTRTVARTTFEEPLLDDDDDQVYGAKL